MQSYVAKGIIQPSQSAASHSFRNCRLLFRVKDRNLALSILLVVALCSILGFAGIKSGGNGTKYLATSLQLIVLLLSFYVISKYYKSVSWGKAFPILIVIAFYPISLLVVRTILDGLNLKSFTDNIVLIAGYYELAFAGLALSMLNRSAGPNVFASYSWFGLIGGCVLIAISMMNATGDNIGWGQITINNCLIPVALLSLCSESKAKMFIGWFSILLLFFLSAKIWSRSYTLVAFYLSALSVLNLIVTGKKKTAFGLVIILLVGYMVGATSIFYQGSIVQSHDDSSIADKFQLDSFFDAIYSFAISGNLSEIFFWQGNSRSEILLDAFGGFSLQDWVFGRGINATYSSVLSSIVTERKTIELGWAQEAFRWGIFYVVFFVVMMVRSVRFLLKSYKGRAWPYSRLLATVIIIKLLDGFVYGLPTFSVYSLLMFWGMFQMSIKTCNFKRADFASAL